MIEVLRQSVDFERVLGSRTRVSSVHFAVHHLADRPTRRFTSTRPVPVELSTGGTNDPPVPVDDSVNDPLPTLPEAVDVGVADRVWLGMVVPKRHARRSVTRSLLKRQVRSVVADCQGGLPAGLWVVRLRAPFDRSSFPSAASDALKQVARAELQQLLADVVANPARLLGPGRRRGGHKPPP